MEEEEDVVEEDMGAVADMEGAVVEAMVRIYSCHCQGSLKVPKMVFFIKLIFEV